MIKYNYNLERDEYDEKKIYKPELIPKELDDLVYIEGPNSSGKSTLLNIIALSLFGHKKKNLNPALKNRLKHLLNSEHQKLTFEVQIINKYLNLEIISKKIDKDKTEIEVRENGKILPSDNFERNYNLIYDIPDNPIDRLKELTKEVRENQERLGNKVGSFRVHLMNTIHDIKTSKDPYKLAEFNKALCNDKKDHIDLSVKIESDQNILVNMEKYIAVRFFKHYSELLEEINRSIGITTKKKKKAKRDDKELTDQMIQYISDLNIKKEEMHKTYLNVTVILKTLIPRREKNHLKIWEDIVIDNEIKEPDFHNDIVQESGYFKKILKEIIRKEKNEEKLRELDLLSDLKKVLEHYRDSVIIIPGVDKTIPQFIRIIDDKIKDHSNLLAKKNNIKNSCELLDELCKLKKELADIIWPRIKKLQELRGYVFKEVSLLEDEEDKQSEFTEQINRYRRKLLYYRKQIARFDINEDNVDFTLQFLLSDNTIKPYVGLPEDQIINRVKEFKGEIEEKQLQLKKIESSIEFLQKDIKRMEEKKPHKFQRHLNKIEKYLDIIQNLEKKLKNIFKVYIDNLIDENITKDSLNKNEIIYYDQIADFLAKKVEYIRHIDKDYKVEKIDLINKEVKTDTKKIIKLYDLGTGQSQSAFLKGLLDTNDKRKIIALFDEVAMMDDKSLKPIYDKLKKLYKEKKLLAGIIVQKGEQVKIETKL